MTSRKLLAARRRAQAGLAHLSETLECPSEVRERARELMQSEELLDEVVQRAFGRPVEWLPRETQQKGPGPSRRSIWSRRGVRPWGTCCVSIARRPASRGTW